MAIVTLDQVKAHLNFTPDMAAADDALLTAKLAAAQGYIERSLGYRIEARFGGVDQDPVPADLREAVLQLASWWFENRETVNVGNIVNQVPFGVTDIVTAHREWSF